MWEHVFFFVHTYIFINFFALYRQSLLKGRHCQSGQIFINSFSWRASTPSTNTAKKEPKISNAREQRPLPSICVKYTNPGSLLSTPVSYRHPCSKRKIRQKISHLPASGLCPAWVFSFLNIVHFFFFFLANWGWDRVVHVSIPQRHFDGLFQNVGGLRHQRASPFLFRRPRAELQSAHHVLKKVQTGLDPLPAPHPIYLLMVSARLEKVTPSTPPHHQVWGVCGVCRFPPGTGPGSYRA